MARRIKKQPGRSSRESLADVITAKPENDESLTATSDSDEVFNVTLSTNIPVERNARVTLQADEYSAQVTEKIFQPVDETKGETISAAVFDEAGYLRLNPDVRHAIELGQFESGYSHYVLHGRAEGRPSPNMPTEVRNVIVTSIGIGQPDVASMRARCSIDALLIAPGAGLMVVGWIDDVTHPISCIRVISSGWRLVIDASRFVRVRRMDVEKAIDSRAPHSFGFLGFLHFDRGGEISGPLQVEFWQQGGIATALQCTATIVGDIELRNTALSHLANASFFGNHGIESMGYLAQGVGVELVRLNRAITRRLVATPFVERFGPQRGTYRGTIIVCLYGKPEFYFVQNCLYSGLPGIEDYEFVFVSNSPEMAETLLREAQSASIIYGLTNSVMILAGNAGFGGANNAAARIARSNRLLIVNPDVFPRDRDWAKKHTDLLTSAASETTRLFGAPLYYDDGSLMHGGMYFETDIGLTMAGGKPTAQQICRVEHYGKGAPPESSQFTRPRPVPAVTGAFISIDSDWFAELGGFTEDFIFGHYEDADLCLKSIERGVAPWLQDIRMWHLEGKGSTRQLVHEGGSMVNRWLFSQTWMSTIEAGLKGPAPSHPLFRSSLPTASDGVDIDPEKPRSDRRRRVI